MPSEYYLYSIFLIMLLAVLDRLRETVTFWFEISIFNLLPETWRKWFDSRDELEKRFIKIGGKIITLHPIFWDGYHFAKNLSVLFMLLYLGLIIHWSLIFIGALVWFIFQYLAYTWFILDEFENYNG